MHHVRQSPHRNTCGREREMNKHHTLPLPCNPVSPELGRFHMPRMSWQSSSSSSSCQVRSYPATSSFKTWLGVYSESYAVAAYMFPVHPTILFSACRSAVLSH